MVDFNTGHRDRVKKQFIELDNKSNIPDYKIIEQLLFLSIPRRDTKYIANTLIHKFKNINNIIYADPASLEAVPGIGKYSIYVIQLIKELINRILKEQFNNREILSSIPEVIEYCKFSIGTSPIELLKVLYTNTRNMLIVEETAQTGTINQTPIYTREIIKRALEVGAAGIIIAHNHPSGDVEPSQNDINITRQLKDAAERLNIKLHDHLIIGRYSSRSMRSMGLLD